MEYKPLFGAVSALAIAAAVPVEANAGVRPGSTGIEQARRDISSDPVLDFILATNSDLTPASMERGLRHVFNAMHTAQAEALPAFVRGLWTVGLSTEAHQFITETLLVMLSGSESVDDETVARIGGELLAIDGSGAVSHQVAQLPIDDFCDFNQPEAMQVLDPDCPPVTLTAPPATTPQDGNYSA